MLTWGTSGCGALGRVGPRLRDPKPTLLRPAPVLFKRQHGGGRVVIVDVACGTYCTFALAEGGAVYGWGLNNYGHLALPGLVRSAPHAGTRFFSRVCIWPLLMCMFLCRMLCSFVRPWVPQCICLEVNIPEQLALPGMCNLRSSLARSSNQNCLCGLLTATCAFVASCGQ